ncbi:MAG: PAS domain-containing protein [Chloroflexi bacterium]|jgi:transcriptional regulator with PAS, ATPase and Fis domain|nr:PAS domain-containing protein [Anaerolineaceae bacterium]NMB86730.1 PAS domain-containing protein [Chloroflexota bacterium]
MSKPDWDKQFPGAITVTDTSGTILWMNERSIQQFKNDGGEALVGQSVYDCHPLPAQEIIRRLLANQSSNAYTIEKNGVKKLVFQSPWYQDGQCGGLVEISFQIPQEMPHFIRG